MNQWLPSVMVITVSHLHAKIEHRLLHSGVDVDPVTGVGGADIAVHPSVRAVVSDDALLNRHGGVLALDG